MAGVLRPRPVPGPVPRRAPVAAQGRVSRSERLDAVQVVHGQRHGDGERERRDDGELVHRVEYAIEKCVAPLQERVDVLLCHIRTVCAERRYMPVSYTHLTLPTKA